MPEIMHGGASGVHFINIPKGSDGLMGKVSASQLGIMGSNPTRVTTMIPHTVLVGSRKRPESD